jgi:hypothetical protein
MLLAKLCFAKTKYCFSEKAYLAEAIFHTQEIRKMQLLQKMRIEGGLPEAGW